MPEIYLGNWGDGLDRLAPVRLLATMQFPEDRSRREELVAAAELFLLHVQPATEPSSPAARVLSLHRFAGDMRVNWGGTLAGLVLVTVRAICEQRPEYEEVGVKKAVRVVEADLLAAKDQRPDKRPINERTIMSGWARYKSVAHLWSSFHLLYNLISVKHDNPTPDDDNGLSEKVATFLKPQLLSTFLAIGENMRLWGEAHVNKRTKAPILLPTETWRSPEGLVTPSTSLKMSPLSDVAIKALAEYRA